MVIRSYLFLLFFFHQNNPPTLRFWFFLCIALSCSKCPPLPQAHPHSCFHRTFQIRLYGWVQTLLDWQLSHSPVHSVAPVRAEQLTPFNSFSEQTFWLITALKAYVWLITHTFNDGCIPLSAVPSALVLGTLDRQRPSVASLFHSIRI